MADKSWRPKLVRGVYAFALGLGYGCAFAACGVGVSGQVWGAFLGLLVGIGAFVFLLKPGAPRWRATQILVTVVVPIWGYALNASLADCTKPCASEYRLLSMPQINGLYAGYLTTLVAYAVSQSRPEMQRPSTEVSLLALLLTGVVLMVPVGIHYGPISLFGLTIAPFALPLFAPYAIALLYGAEFVRRTRRRGEDEAARRLAAGLAIKGALASPLLLGLYAAIHALWLGHAGGAADVFTQTCGEGVFAQIKPPAGDCHYLCTVAAQGHPRLVKPERMGRRRGQPVLVNRQLAVANAFEDLLHERWPRFGRAARRLYDRLALPVSALIKSRWVADAIYLAMKPAEWLFYLALLLFDREPPEGRIARMYR